MSGKNTGTQAKAGFADINLNSWEGVLLILFIILGVWKILAIGLVTFMVGFILMVIFYVYTQQGLLNWGTIVFAIGLALLLITYVKFLRKLNKWRNKAESPQEKISGNP